MGLSQSPYSCAQLPAREGQAPCLSGDTASDAACGGVRHEHVKWLGSLARAGLLLAGVECRPRRTWPRYLAPVSSARDACSGG